MLSIGRRGRSDDRDMLAVRSVVESEVLPLEATAVTPGVLTGAVPMARVSVVVADAIG